MVLLLLSSLSSIKQCRPKDVEVFPFCSVISIVILKKKCYLNMLMNINMFFSVMAFQEHD